MRKLLIIIVGQLGQRLAAQCYCVDAVVSLLSAQAVSGRAARPVHACCPIRSAIGALLSDHCSLHNALCAMLCYKHWVGHQVVPWFMAPAAWQQLPAEHVAQHSGAPATPVFCPLTDDDRDGCALLTCICRKRPCGKASLFTAQFF